MSPKDKSALSLAQKKALELESKYNSTNEALNKALAEVDRLRRDNDMLQCISDNLRNQLDYVRGCHKAREQGMEAFRSGLSKNDNPFNKHVPLTEQAKGWYESWNLGWEEQHLDRMHSKDRTQAIRSLTNALTVLRLEISPSRYDANEIKRKKEATVKEMEQLVQEFNKHGK